MKKIISGSSVLITGAIIFLAACIAGSLNMQTINGWDTNTGRFWTSISEGRLMPMVVISIIIMVIGAIIIVWGHMCKTDNK